MESNSIFFHFNKVFFVAEQVFLTEKRGYINKLIIRQIGKWKSYMQP